MDSQYQTTAMPRQLPLVETHRNHYLFSDHYLNAILPRQAVWREAEGEARQALEAIAARYREVADALPHYNEAQAERHWIQPVLDILGHVYHVQPALPDAAGRPDYAFFADETVKSAATPQLGTAVFWETALAVGDAKRWDRSLDKRILDGAPDAFTNANPCYQIDYYLRRTGCTWGLVSNGRRWRLYHRDSSYRLDVFYEVDLAQLIEQGDVAAFRYFYLFFRADAFQPDVEGRCWLDTVLAESTAYAVRVGDELTDRVYEALRLLAQGFLDYPGGTPPLRRLQLEPSQGFDLPHIHDACLILLYRLLFLFYAESRGLLPLDNPSYREQYSLKAIKEDITAKLDAGVVFLPRRATLWDDLKTLSGIIYEGSRALGVPAYNGGLFNPAKHPFLEEHAIGDRYLAQAIDLLARAGAGQGQGLSFVDYRDLSIRHLGSIYEGLLEYRLQIADGGLQGVDGELQVELVTERGERKATGSYYTPDYIVKYIVEQTLGPLADAQAEAVQKEVEALKARNRGAARRTKAYKDELARLQNSFADRILALNVLDPAMGSGHFLVEATDYLARRIVEAGVVSEVLVNGSTLRQAQDKAALTGTGDEESELSYWRRRVVERCIYGVDLNPLAVELAKLSLWLATVAKGKPLSFLDHHLRGGNSLIGARVADLQALPVRKKGRRKTSKVSQTLEVSQLAIWDEGAFTQDMFRVVGAMQQIQEYESADLVSVQEKERIFAETVERERRKWRDIADLWTAAYFGLELTPQLYNACVQHAQGKPVLLQAAQAEALLAQAHQIWEDKRFFHWEIEFPEIFFDQHGQHKGEAAGFDAVMGNPPYGVIQDKIQKWLIEEHFISFQGNLENYCFFIETFYQLAQEKGRIGYITPLTWLHIPQFRNLRRMVLEWEVDSIVSLPTKVFGDANLDTVIGVGKKAQVAEDSVVKVTRVQVASPEGIANADTRSIRQMVWCSDTDKKIDLSYDEQADKLLRKIERESVRLAEICRVSQGLVPYAREEFYRVYSKEEADRIVDTRAWHADHQVDETFRKELRGEDVSRYEVVWNGRQWIKYGKWLARPRTPEFFTEPRLLIREITRGDRLNAGFTDEELYNNPGIINVIPSTQQYALVYLLAIVNSALMFYYHRYRSPKARLVTSIPKILVEDVERLPIRRIEFTTPPEERERLVEDALERYEAYLEHGEDVMVRAFVVTRLMEEPEQADIVHDILAHLAKRMIEMHKQKQAEVKDFLGWLADYTGLPIDQWALKTSLRRYYEHDWAEMQRILKRNQRQLPNVDLDVDAYRNEPAQKIREAWETSMETLRPLLARIKATDWLIDRIVYRLYGLTEEEIGVVEERAGG